jgi:hypothetical protein
MDLKRRTKAPGQPSAEPGRGAQRRGRAKPLTAAVRRGRITSSAGDRAIWLVILVLMAWH